MKKISKELSLAEINCSEEVFLNLERLHYEVSARERVLAISLSNENTSIQGSFDDYYKNYLKIYQEYEAAKDHFYKTYVDKHVDEKLHTMWEASFPSRSVFLYE